jgi:hypothetical protein
MWLENPFPDVFFEATVVALEPAPSGQVLVRLSGLRSIVGDVATAVTTPSHSDSCGFTFATGERYLIHAERGADGSLSTSSCTKTAPRSAAGEHLAYLASLARPATGGRVFGKAQWDWRVETMFDEVNQRPLAALRISLRGPVNRTALTAADGTFSFDRLPPGRYAVSALSPPAMKLPGRLSDEFQLPNARACHESHLFFERPRR